MRLRTGRGPIAPSAASAVDSSFPRSLVLAGHRRRPLALLAIGAAAYLAGLVFTLPAGLIVEDGEGTNITDVAGTVWHGEAALIGGELLEWRWSPLRSLIELGFAVDWTVIADRTSLAGRARLRPGSLVIAGASGTASGTLLKSVVPDLPFACDLAMQVDIAQATFGETDHRIAGRILSDAGSCAPKGSVNATTPVPALLFEATPDGPNSRARIVRQALRRVTLGDVRLTEAGKLTVTITRDGAAVLPFTAPPGGLTIETTL